MYVPTALVCHAHTGQEMVSDSLEVDFRPIVSDQVDAKN